MASRAVCHCQSASGAENRPEFQHALFRADHICYRETGIVSPASETLR
jgi:hypothetical protein